MRTFPAADSSGRIRKVDATTKIITTIAGIAGNSGFSGDGGPATAARINSPRDLVFDAAGVLHFVDNGNARIRVVNLSAADATFPRAGASPIVVTPGAIGSPGGGLAVLDDEQEDVLVTVYDAAGKPTHREVLAAPRAELHVGEP